MTMFRPKERSRSLTSDTNDLLCREDSITAFPVSHRANG